MVPSWKVFVDSCRLISVCGFLICSLTFTWYSFGLLICLLGSLYLLDREKYTVKPLAGQDLHPNNPYKGHKRVKGEENLPDNIKNTYTQEILNHVLYDAENCQALRNFEQVKRNTHCTFARTAILWGARDYDMSLTLEANIERSIPTLIKFFAIGESLHLDGFVFELPGEEFGKDTESFGEGVRRVLSYISEQDPAGYHCMNKSFVSQIGWSFEFNTFPIFVTTFAPCYPENHSRYAFGAVNAFILLQPMYSFAIHEIGHDTPATNWDNPQTIRDKIRVAYKENGRPYYIRDTVYYPMAHDIVKPLIEGPGNVVEWWKSDGGNEQENLSSDESFTSGEDSSGLDGGKNPGENSEGHENTSFNSDSEKQDIVNGASEAIGDRQGSIEELDEINTINGKGKNGHGDQSVNESSEVQVETIPGEIDEFEVVHATPEMDGM